MWVIYYHQEMRQTLKNNKQHTKKGDLKMKSEMNKTTEKNWFVHLVLALRIRKRLKPSLPSLKKTNRVDRH